MDFNIYEENIFHLNLYRSLALYNSDLRQIQAKAYLTQVANKLFSMCAVMNEFPYIGYQQGSSMSNIVAKGLVNAFTLFQQNAGEQEWRENKATLIILDRSVDLVAPTIHGFAYQPLLADFRTISRERKVVVSDNGSKPVQGHTDPSISEDQLLRDDLGPAQKYHSLDEKDKIWNQLRG